ncbi:MAG: hypothetical protein AB7G62_12115 [Magnetospirillum sp.]
MGIAAGIDQVQRETLKKEGERRVGLNETDYPQQLGLRKERDLSTAQDAMTSMLAIRDADDKAAAVKQAQGKISELKTQNPQAAIVLKNQLDAFVSNPASVPALLRQDEIDMFLARGSDFQNYFGIGSAGLETAALLFGGSVPVLGPLATTLAPVGFGVAATKEGERRKTEAELARRRLNGRSGKGSGR